MVVAKGADSTRNIFSYLRSWLPAQIAMPVKRCAANGLLTDALMPDTAEEALEIAKDLNLPKSFLIGAATAAYQVEGGLYACTWSDWEKSGRNGEHRAGKACDAWNRFPDDVEHAKSLGLRMLRFSIEWSRIEPKEGIFDASAMSRYVEWCELLHSKGIEPMVTLHHFSEPSWFDAKGGWERRENVQYFARFVEYATARLAPVCKHWCTINELNGFAVCGWLAGVHPPGVKDDPITMLTVIRHMLVGHSAAAKAIRAASARNLTPPSICLSLSHIVFVASWWAPFSYCLARWLNYVFNYIYIEALLYGRLWLPYDILAWLLGWRADVRALEGTIDVIGVNHYYRSIVKFGFDASTAEAPAQPSVTDLFLRLPLGLLLRASSVDGFEKSDMGWDLTPTSMEVLLSSMWERYRMPMIVTESGIADGEEPDTRRSRYLAACLSVASRLRDKGVDLRGYLFWTLLDNFEWAEGFRPRFGLLRTDFDTLERQGRESNAIIRAAVAS